MKVCFSFFLILALLISGCGTTATSTLPTVQAVSVQASPQPATPTVLGFTPTLETSTPEVQVVTATLQSTDTPQPTVTSGIIIEIVSDAPQVAVPSSQTCQHPQNWVIYTVQHNDTLSALGQRTGTSTQRIQAANCLTGTLIFAGQPLYLPFIPAPQMGTNVPSSGSNSPSNQPSAGPTIRTPKVGLPGDHLVSISPSSGPPGTEFTLSVNQYASNEKVIITIISVNTNLPVLEQTLYTDDDGNLTWFYKSPGNLEEGAYKVYEDGMRSNAAGKGDFSITPPPATTSP